ncbi:shikimate dehydrogenase [Cognatishimia activa]|uniref:Shikimate dehydrogenase (NADP(+)) n=1 Tax=Cognatishimia activa TaxID=1715691 RepID=A0A0P1J2A7_9RHOB|nr:shikimate dehydrogenase [Cognatishimia activa]CUI41258.1 Shikimate dehydrogenase [Cognatishimia activa]CUK24572.1 Shikimate dehydrogenase [Cognatishimia activa]
MTLPKVPLAAVIGHPIAHSKSPMLHGHWLKTYGINGHYIPMDVAPDDLETVLRNMHKMGFVGANVTIPHKTRALEIADQVTDRATLIGAANTLIFHEDGKILADNTDGYGFIQNLRQSAPDWDPTAGAAVVLGAGGAARAVVASLLDVGVPEIFITNRTRVRAEQLRDDFGARLKVVEWVQAGDVIEDGTTIVNTTSLGMTGKPELKVSLDGLQPGSLVTDLVYTPLRTPFLDEAAQRGCVSVDGLGMLLHQAAPGFERWFGPRPEVTEDLRRVILG